MFFLVNSFEKPVRAHSDQLFIMMRYETPTANVFPYEDYKGFFNWTWSNRFDADVYVPNSYFAPVDQEFEMYNRNHDWISFQTGSYNVTKLRQDYFEKEVRLENGTTGGQGIVRVVVCS